MVIRRKFLQVFFSSLLIAFVVTFTLMANYRRYKIESHVDFLLKKHVNGSGFSDLLQKTNHKHRSFGGKTVAEKMFPKVKILCLIFTYPENHYKKAVYVNATWGQKCNTLKFMTSKEEKDLPTIALPIKESRSALWNKTKAGIRWAYANHLQDHDWFFKGDDDSYAILENMRYILSFYNPQEPWIFGSRFKPFSKKGYMSGGGGYMLSKASVQLLVEKSFDNSSICHSAGAEDAEIGRCLSNQDAYFGDTRDQSERWRFLPFHLENFLLPGSVPKWFWDWIYYNITLSMNCCSDTAVTSHYVGPNKMHFYHYMVYHLRPAGITKIPVYYPKVLFH